MESRHDFGTDNSLNRAIVPFCGVLKEMRGIKIQTRIF